MRIFRERGVADLFRLLREEPQLLRGAFIADKVVGKGAAALMVLGGVEGLFADVVSRPALELLAGAGIAVEYTVVVPGIMNRAGTGTCPVEQLCAGAETAAGQGNGKPRKPGRGENRDAEKTGTRGKPGHESRTEPNGGYRIQPSFRTTRAHRTLGAPRMARVPQLSRRRRTLRGHQSSGHPGLGQARPTRNAGAHATPGTPGVASRRCGRGGHPVKMVA